MEDKNKIKKELDKAQKEGNDEKVVDLPHKGLENEVAVYPNWSDTFG